VAGVSGVSGNTNYHLNAPASITLDYSNTLYISDFNNDRVQKYLRDASVGSTVAGNGVGGSSSNQLHGPYNVVLNTNGDIFVADSKNNRIQFWSNGGNSGTTIAGNASGRIEKVHSKHFLCSLLKILTDVKLTSMFIKI
jgi:hypothetical protein